MTPKPWVLPPLSNSWIISIISLYIALNRTPNINCYWVGAVPNLNPSPEVTAMPLGIVDFVDWQPPGPNDGGFRV